MRALLAGARKKSQITLTWSYRTLQAAIWVLRTKPTLPPFLFLILFFLPHFPPFLPFQQKKCIFIKEKWRKNSQLQKCFSFYNLYRCLTFNKIPKHSEDANPGNKFIRDARVCHCPVYAYLQMSCIHVIILSFVKKFFLVCNRVIQTIFRLGTGKPWVDKSSVGRVWSETRAQKGSAFILAEFNHITLLVIICQVISMPFGHRLWTGIVCVFFFLSI